MARSPFQGGSHSKKNVRDARPTPQKRARQLQPPAKPARLGVDVAYMTALLALTMLVSAGLLQNQLVGLMPQAGQAGVRAILLFVVYLIELVALSYAAFRHRQQFFDFYRLRPVVEREKRRTSEAATPAATSTSGAQASSEHESAHVLPWYTSAGLVMAFLIGLRLLAVGWTLFTDDIGWRITNSSNVLDIFGTSHTGLIITVVMVIIFAPLVEELIFRGLLQRWLASKLSISISILLTSALFALYHLSFWAAPLNFVLGAACGFLAHKSKTLLPAIALHLLYNATLVLAALYLAAG